MIKQLMTCFVVLSLLTLSACSCTKMDSTTAPTNGNNLQNGNRVSDNSDVPAVNNAKNTNDVPSGDNTQKITDIQKPDNIGKTFTIQGKVVNTLQSARFNVSGYKIQDSTGTIDVSSRKIPQMNTTVTVTGTLIQTRYFGLVINETG
jgi:hypothetical protein